MIIYDQVSIAFIRKAQEMLKEILGEIGLPVKTSRFLFQHYLYPIKVVVFEGSEWGHFHSAYFQIGLNKKLIYLAKDSVLRDILKHELAHYLTWIKYGEVASHGKEFHETCRFYGFSSIISEATLNLESANLAKEGDLEAEKILEKVKKLLQLAQSSNPHEAEIATMKANALLLRHNLDHLKQDLEEPLFMERVMSQKRKDAKLMSVYEILRHFLVRPVVSMGKGVCSIEITGSKTNVKLASYVAHYLDLEMERLWQQTRQEFKLEGLRAKNSFFLGLAKGFGEKMTSSKEQFSSEDQKALILVEKNLDHKIRQIYGRLSSTQSTHRPDERASSLGFKKGREMNIRQGVEGKLKNLFLTYQKDRSS
jgi:hypothetical protein